MLDENRYRFRLDDTSLTMWVKPPSVFLRGIYFFFAFLTGIGPIVGLVLSVTSGSGFHFGMLFGMGISGLISFYLLRVALWNTYGKETLSFSGDKVVYHADYGWFKDAKKVLPVLAELSFEIKSIGYEEEKQGTLLINYGSDQKLCASRMHEDDLAILIESLTKIQAGSIQ